MFVGVEGQARLTGRRRPSRSPWFPLARREKKQRKDPVFGPGGVAHTSLARLKRAGDSSARMAIGRARVVTSRNLHVGVVCLRRRAVDDVRRETAVAPGCTTGNPTTPTRSSGPLGMTSFGPNCRGRPLALPPPIITSAIPPTRKRTANHQSTKDPNHQSPKIKNLPLNRDHLKSVRGQKTRYSFRRHQSPSIIRSTGPRFATAITATRTEPSLTPRLPGCLRATGERSTRESFDGARRRKRVPERWTPGARFMRRR